MGTVVDLVGGGGVVGDYWYVRRQRLWEWRGVGGGGL